MKILDRFKNALKGFSTTTRFFQSLTSFGSNLRRKSAENDPVGSYAGFVYAALSKRAKRVGAINIHLYDLKRNGDLEELEDHELLSLLYRVNPKQSKYQFFYTIEMFLGIWGAAPVYKDRAGGTRIQYLWPLRPDLLKPITNHDGQVVSYQYRIPGAKVQDLAAEDVIMINEPSPLSISAGFSPLQAAALEIDVDMAAAIWNKQLIENFAEPGGILTTEQKLDDKEFERLQKTWHARHGGPSNAGRWALLEKGLKAEAIGRSPKDMDLVESRKFNRNAITSILGVPMSLMTSEDVNLANAEVGERVFAKDTIEPQMRLITECLNEFLIPDYSDSLWLDFDSPVPDDVQQKINIAVAGEGRFMTINEAREIFNLPALEGGDAIFKPIGVIPQVGEGAEGSNEAPKGYERLEVKVADEQDSPRYRAVKRAIMAKTKTRRDVQQRVAEKMYEKITSRLAKATEDNTPVKVSIKGAKLVETKDDSDTKEVEHDPRILAERKSFLKAIPKQEKKFVRQMKHYFDAQEKEIMKNLEEQGLPKGRSGKVAVKSSVNRWINKILFDQKKQDDALVEMAGEVYRDNISVGSAAVAGLLGLTPSEVLATPFVVNFIQERSFLMLSVNHTTTEKLKETLALGVAQGESLGEIRERITEVYEDARGFRAETIARTEVGSSQNFGRLAEMENQKVEKKVWIAIFSNTRDAHAVADGQVVGVHEHFDVGGEALEFPGDPNGSAANTINCQCSVSPTLA